MNSDKFRDEAHQMDERDRRREWPKLHGDGVKIWETDIDRANRRIMDLEAEVALLKGGMRYLETDKVPWLEWELDRERNAGWRKG